MTMSGTKTASKMPAVMLNIAVSCSGPKSGYPIYIPMRGSHWPGVEKFKGRVNLSALAPSFNWSVKFFTLPGSIWRHNIPLDLDWQEVSD